MSKKDVSPERLIEIESIISQIMEVAAVSFAHRSIYRDWKKTQFSIKFVGENIAHWFFRCPTQMKKLEKVCTIYNTDTHKSNYCSGLRFTIKY